MAKRKRLNRTTDMDNALFEALKTAVPEKNTGPDPDDILAELFDDEDPALTRQSVEDVRAVTITLGKEDRARANKVMQLVARQCGEQIGLDQAIRMALFSCSLQDEALLEAYRAICARTDKNE